MPIKKKGRSDGVPISFDTDIRNRNGRRGFECRKTPVGCQIGRSQQSEIGRIPVSVFSGSAGVPPATLAVSRASQSGWDARAPINDAPK